MTVFKRMASTGEYVTDFNLASMGYNGSHIIKV